MFNIPRACGKYMMDCRKEKAIWWKSHWNFISVNGKKREKNANLYTIIYEI